MSSYVQVAKGERQAVPKALVAEVPSPPVQVTRKFRYQSYFDSSLLEGAVLAQAATEPIVASTLRTEDTTGFAAGLHPSSECPIAIEFKLSAVGYAGATLTLTPGQIITPTGLPPRARESGGFVGFRYGLPFGWLGGGLAHLIVFRTPETKVDWSGNPEVIFQRVRIPILQPTDLTALGSNNNARNNWPSRFPWTSAPSLQAGSGILGVTPTRTLITLRGFTTLASPADMRLIFQGTNEFARSSADAVVLTNPVYEDITWPQFDSFGTSGNLASQNPALVLNGAIARLGADDGGLAAVETSGAALLSGGFIDVVRYGRL